MFVYSIDFRCSLYHSDAELWCPELVIKHYIMFKDEEIISFCWTLYGFPFPNNKLSDKYFIFGNTWIGKGQKPVVSRSVKI